MARKFAELRSRMSPESQARSEAKARKMLAEMPLHELRQALGLSQKVLAHVLHVQQPSIAKLERRTDMYVSTLRSHIEAMGGMLDVVARFPEGDVRITNFSEIVAAEAGDAAPAPASPRKPTKPGRAERSRRSTRHRL